MNFRRLRKDIHIVLKGHILNWPWRSRQERRKARGEATLQAVSRYLSKYIPVIQSVSEDNPGNDNGTDRIFSIWLQGEEQSPNIVKACYSSMRHHCSQELIILDEKNLNEWIELPDYIIRKWEEGKIRPAHFADICRVELLYQYGGIWLDATDFVTRPIPEEILNEDFFLYMAGHKLFGWYSYIQNCFIRARRHNYLIKVWRAAIHEYWKQEDRIADYFMHQILFKLVVENNELAAEYFAAMPKIDQDMTHSVWWEHHSDPYNADLYEELTREVFFQKTEFKSQTACNPIPNSFADHILNMYK